ncbi:MAG: hypothetical protein JW751_04930 [Polyangiaceae bacterium]|nr:hypothetical protein [Polyangiaceae bacterium]
MVRSLIQLTVPCLTVLLVACGSGGEKPEAKSANAANSETAAAASTEGAAEPEAADDSTAEAEKAPEPEQIKPSEVLTTPDVAFAFDYNSSGLKEKHEEKCKSVKDNPSALAACLNRERAAFKADVIQFFKDAENKLTFVVYVRKGNTLAQVFEAPAEFADETGSSVTLKLAAGGHGSQQICAGQREIPLRLPDKYGIEIDDPKWGKLTYASKVGIVPQKPPK